MIDLLSIVRWIDHHIIIVMMLMFVAIIITTYWPGRKKSIEQQGQIPFKDDV